MFRGITLKNKAGKSLRSSIFMVNSSFQVNIKLNKAVCFSECSSVYACVSYRMCGCSIAVLNGSSGCLRLCGSSTEMTFPSPSLSSNQITCTSLIQCKLNQL